MSTEFPALDSLWINLKHGTEYRTWVVANDPGGSSFVVYQVSDRPILEPPYFVEHTEIEGLMGKVSGHHVYMDGMMYLVEWFKSAESKSIQRDAWARPSSMWSERFRMSGEFD